MRDRHLPPPLSLDHISQLVLHMVRVPHFPLCLILILFVLAPHSLIAFYLQPARLSLPAHCLAPPLAPCTLSCLALREEGSGCRQPCSIRLLQAFLTTSQL